MIFWIIALILSSVFLGIYLGMWITVRAYLDGRIQDIEKKVRGDNG